MGKPMLAGLSDAVETTGHADVVDANAVGFLAALRCLGRLSHDGGRRACPLADIKCVSLRNPDDGLAAGWMLLTCLTTPGALGCPRDSDGRYRHGNTVQGAVPQDIQPLGSVRR